LLQREKPLYAEWRGLDNWGSPPDRSKVLSPSADMLDRKVRFRTPSAAEHAYPSRQPERLILQGLVGPNKVHMVSIDIQITAPQGGTPANAAEHSSIPQTVSPVPPPAAVPTASLPETKQDTVSLSGTVPPQRQQRNPPSHHNPQPAAFTLLAITTAFPPAPNAAPVNVIAASSAQTAASSESPVALAAAGAAPNASPESASSLAPPQQTLQQLDRVLQQLGIDPQSLSLISREEMLNWVNDPAALRQIVQNLQSASSSSPGTNAVGAANLAQSTAQRAVTGANQFQIQPQTQNQPQVIAQEANLSSGSASPAGSADTDAPEQSAATAQQNAAAVTQFQQLEHSLAPGGVQETPAANPDGSTTLQGQLLNVTA